LVDLLEIVYGPHDVKDIIINVINKKKDIIIPFLK